ncbi:immunity 49 family protein [Streptomyces longwoodensis]|uniref:immunity 49 family protein n=1 Tax=Streptomyces longwoodensis TaxID=68231 RepID=UPI003403225C
MTQDASHPVPPMPTTADDLLRVVHTRLLPADAIGPELAGAFRYARTVADGLLRVYALDGPAGVRMLTDADVHLVQDEGVLEQAARTNLMRIPVTHEEIALDGGVRLHSLHGDSPFVASQALFLSQAAHQAGLSLPDAGALFVIPSRHHLVYQPLTDGSVADGINHLAAYALGAHEDSGPGALSPRVYWWYRGGLLSLTVIDPETRTFSIEPPVSLLDLLKGLVRLDRAGRIATRAAAGTPDMAELARWTAESVTALAQNPSAPSSSALSHAFASAVTLAHARTADDPDAALVGTWDAWAAAVQLGSALFTGARPQDCSLGDGTVVRLPGLPAGPPADARAWLDAFYLAVVCRQEDRIGRLCRVPLSRLREDDSVDAYVLHWIDTLQTYFSPDRLTMDDVVEKLVATMQTSGADEVTHAPSEFVNAVDYQPVALFHRLIARDQEKFTETLTEALGEHAGYWAPAPTAPRARTPLGVLALASLAHDYGFAVQPKQRHLPTYLLNGQRLEEIPAP